jgi:CheY-like chemotaxis protein
MARILVIDDSEFVREFLSDCLSEAGHEVLIAENGTEGLELFSSKTPDCVLLDVLLPDIDGIEVLRRLRGVNASVPVMLMTGDDPGWARRTCEEYGANGFLSKAFYADKVVESVEELLLAAD